MNEIKICWHEYLFILTGNVVKAEVSVLNEYLNIKTAVISNNTM